MAEHIIMIVIVLWKAPNVHSLKFNVIIQFSVQKMKFPNANNIDKRITKQISMNYNSI